MSARIQGKSAKKKKKSHLMRSSPCFMAHQPDATVCISIPVGERVKSQTFILTAVCNVSCPLWPEHRPVQLKHFNNFHQQSGALLRVRGSLVLVSINVLTLDFLLVGVFVSSLRTVSHDVIFYSTALSKNTRMQREQMVGCSCRNAKKKTKPRRMDERPVGTGLS